ncbi:Hypothetical predicted protein [Octopus vulgaris]|uniref:Uncharacterized protein n=1 Tax=Octopus vulgaris TaxID=6645 RepID=A0AA36B2V9_OCTVU|nr:Hypothetical predicted protein [Octopus vulgaris]
MIFSSRECKLTPIGHCNRFQLRTGDNPEHSFSSSNILLREKSTSSHRYQRKLSLDISHFSARLSHIYRELSTAY